MFSNMNSLLVLMLSIIGLSGCLQTVSAKGLKTGEFVTKLHPDMLRTTDEVENVIAPKGGCGPPPCPLRYPYPYPPPYPYSPPYPNHIAPPNCYWVCPPMVKLDSLRKTDEMENVALNPFTDTKGKICASSYPCPSPYPHPYPPQYPSRCHWVCPQ